MWNKIITRRVQHSCDFFNINFKAALFRYSSCFLLAKLKLYILWTQLEYHKCFPEGGKT